jgi:Flp pilus assembly protein TadG
MNSQIAAPAGSSIVGKFLGKARRARFPAGGHFRLEKFRLSCRRNRSGVAVVEFAIVAPVFVLFVLGMIEVARGLMIQEVVINAAREGARAAVVDTSTSSSVTSTVQTYLTAANVPTTAATITVTIPATRYNNYATVTVAVPYSKVSWVPVPKFLGSVTLTATSTMRCEAVSTD